MAANSESTYNSRTEAAVASVSTSGASNYSSVSTSIKAHKLFEIRSKYFIPTSYVISIPKPSDRMHLPPPGFQTIHIASLKAGLRLPLPPFVESLLLHLDLNLTQLSPNCHRHIVGFMILMRHLGQAINVDNFLSLYEIEPSSKSEAGFYYFRPLPDHKFLHNVKNSYGSWKKEFLFVQAPELHPWLTRLNWNLGKMSVSAVHPSWDEGFLSSFLSKYYDSEKLVTPLSIQMMGLCDSHFGVGGLTLGDIVAQAELYKDYVLEGERHKKVMEPEKRRSESASRKRPSAKALLKQKQQASKKGRSLVDEASPQASIEVTKGADIASSALDPSPLRVAVPSKLTQIPPPILIPEDPIEDASLPTKPLGIGSSTPSGHRSGPPTPHAAIPISEPALPLSIDTGIFEDQSSQEGQGSGDIYSRIISGPASSDLLNHMVSLESEHRLRHPLNERRFIPPYDASKKLLPDWKVMQDSSIVTPGIPLEIYRNCIPTKDLVRYVEKDPCALDDTFSIAMSQLVASHWAMSLQNYFWRNKRAVSDETMKCALRWLQRAPVDPSKFSVAKGADVSAAEILEANESDVKYVVKEFQRLSRHHLDSLREHEGRIAQLEEKLKTTSEECEALKVKHSVDLSKAREEAKEEGIEAGRKLAFEEFDRAASARREKVVEEFCSSSSFKMLLDDRASSSALEYYELCLSHLKHLGHLPKDFDEPRLDATKSDDFKEADEAEDEEYIPDEYDALVRRIMGMSADSPSSPASS